LLRRVKNTPDEVDPPPRYIGVDDWAMRKGKRYGTIIIDLERGRVLELLPGRDGAALKDWLQEHPGVEVITRARWAPFAQAAAEAAAQAKQVADRWHLLKTLREAVERLLARVASDVHEALGKAPPSAAGGSLDAAPSQADSPPTAVVPAVVGPPGAVPECKPLSPRQQAREAKRQRRIQQYERIRALHAEGLSLHIRRPPVRSSDPVGQAPPGGSWWVVGRCPFPGRFPADGGRTGRRWAARGGPRVQAAVPAPTSPGSEAAAAHPAVRANSGPPRRGALA